MSDARNDVLRTAVLQFDYAPAAVLEFSYLEEPAQLVEGERGITSLHIQGEQGIISQLRESVAQRQSEFTRSRLVQVLERVNELAVDLLVLPEYSVPANCLSVLTSAAPGLCVVAGSHSVTSSTLKTCLELGLHLDQSDVGKSIAPVRMPDGNWQKVEKLTRSKFEGAMRPGTNWDLITARTRRGLKYTVAVMLCVDFINDQDPAFIAGVPRDIWTKPDIFVVPSYTPTIRDFAAKSRAVVERLHHPVVYANVASVGGTSIYCHFRDQNEFVEGFGTKQLPRGSEGLVVADVALKHQQQSSPSPLPVPPTSSLYGVLPLLPEKLNSDYLRVRETLVAARTEDAKRLILEREKNLLTEIASRPSTNRVLSSKLFTLLGGRASRPSGWMDACIDCVPLLTEPATFTELRFELLQESQEALVGILGKMNIRGRDLDDLTRLLDVYRTALDSLRHSVPSEKSTEYSNIDPAIHSVQDSAGAVTSLFMLKLISAKRHRESLEKQVALLTTLAYRGNSDLSLTLRFVSTPSPGGSLKHMEIQIVGAVRADDIASSREKADGYRRELAELLRVTLRDAFFFRLEQLGEQNLADAMIPFPIQDIVEICRHVYFGVSPYVDQATAPRIQHLEGNSSMSRILDVMQSSDNSLLLSIHVRPVSVSEPEDLFFRSYSLAAKSGAEISEAAMFFLGTEPHPALRMNDAVTMRKMLGERVHVHPSLMLRVMLASDLPCPRLLVNTVGAELWGNNSYEIVRHTERESHAAVEKVLRSGWVDYEEEANAPQGLSRIPYLVDPYEASRAFRLPLAADVGAVSSLFTWMPCPIAVLPDSGTELGLGFHAGARKPIVVRLPDEERTKHVYIVGKTGTGKSTLLAKMIEQDIARGAGVCVIDPHGDLVDDVLSRIPNGRTDDVIVLDPGNTKMPFGLNLLEYKVGSRHQKDFVVQETIAMFRKLTYFQNTGPIFEHNLRHLILTMLDQSMGGEGTLIEVTRLLYDDTFRRNVVSKLKDSLAKDFWMQFDQLTKSTRSDQLGYIVSKFNQFTCDRIMRNIFGQSTSTVSIPDVLAGRKVLLVKLQSALVGDQNAALLGMILISKLRWACMARAKMAPNDRGNFFLYVDEFQNFATSGFETLLAEGRKYGLSITLAHQHTAQLSAFDISTGLHTRGVADAVFGNVSTMIAFRLGAEDSNKIAAEMGPPAEPKDFESLKNYYAIMKTLFRGDVYPAFTLKTIPSATLASSEATSKIVANSAKRYARPIESVEQEIDARMARLLQGASEDVERI